MRCGSVLHIPHRSGIGSVCLDRNPSTSSSALLPSTGEHSNTAEPQTPRDTASAEKQEKTKAIPRHILPPVRKNGRQPELGDQESCSRRFDPSLSSSRDGESPRNP